MEARLFRICTVIAAVALLFPACAGEAGTGAETPNDATPSRMESYKTLIKYCKMDENKMIYLDISEKEAEKPGVPSEHYRAGLYDIQCTDEAVQKMIDNGESVEHLKLPDIPDDL